MRHEIAGGLCEDEPRRNRVMEVFGLENETTSVVSMVASDAVYPSEKRSSDVDGVVIPHAD
jgi:hypothetical protein